MDIIRGLVPSILMIVSPILITAAGGMICERSGVVNIALEGLMGIGAFAAASVGALFAALLFLRNLWFRSRSGFVLSLFLSFLVPCFALCGEGLQIALPVVVGVKRQIVQRFPSVDAGVVAVAEIQAHRVTADRLDAD